MSNYLSFCLHSPQVCIQLVSSTWLEGSNLANRSRTPQNASRAEKQKLKCKLYSLRKIDIFCYVHKTDGPRLRHPLLNHSVFSTFKKSLHLLLKSLKVRNMISGPYSRILNTSDVPFDEDLEFEIEKNSSKQQRGSGPYYVFYCVS